MTESTSDSRFNKLQRSEFDTPFVTPSILIPSGNCFLELDTNLIAAPQIV